MKTNRFFNKYITAVFAAAALLWLASCENPEPDPDPVPPTQDEIEARWPEKITVDGLGDFVKVQRDTFTMGSSNGPVDEQPAHDVAFSASYYMGVFEVTQGQWKAFMNGENPSDSEVEGSIHDSIPVNNVTVSDVQKFIEAVESQTGRDFDLPTEAQWEWAAMGGVKSQGYEYAGSNNLDDVAWYTGNSGEMIQKVGKKAPNELGLYDMSGNVSEWCSDRNGKYASALQTDPKGSGSDYNYRGGAFDDIAIGADVPGKTCRIKARAAGSQATYNRGFRLIMVAPLDSDLLPE